MSRRKHRSKGGKSHPEGGSTVEGHEGAAEVETGRDEASGDSADDAPDGEPVAESVDLAAQVERLEARAEEMRELALRKQAEFENYRKRMERERTETIQYAASELVKDILPVLDNLERALGAAEASDEGQLLAGVSIIYKQFKDILEKRGLSEVESEKEAFDPHVHEAVSRVENDAFPEGSVVEVFQKGYRFKDRLLRPAMVSVALPASGKDEPGGKPREEDLE